MYGTTKKPLVGGPWRFFAQNLRPTIYLQLLLTLFLNIILSKRKTWFINFSFYIPVSKAIRQPNNSNNNDNNNKDKNNDKDNNNDNNNYDSNYNILQYITIYYNILLLINNDQKQQNKQNQVKNIENCKIDKKTDKMS